MGRAFKTLAVVAVTLSFLAGCGATTGKTTGQTVDDASITASVKTKLVADKVANLDAGGR